MKYLLVSLLCFGLTADLAYAATKKDDDEEKYYLIKHLQLVHSPEIFRYCLDKYRNRTSKLTSCMAREEKLKNNLFDRAHEQLGQRYLVQAIYYDCLNYYPNDSVKVIGPCVDARLILRERLANNEIEVEIYRRCNKKWSKRNTRAVKNCCAHGANYYLEKGKFRD